MSTHSIPPPPPPPPPLRRPHQNPLLNTTLLRAGKDLGLGAIQLCVPATRRIETSTHKCMHEAQDTMREVGESLVDNAKAAAQGGEEEGTKDLLSLRVKAKAKAKERDNELDGGAAGAGAGAMSDVDVLAQVPPFLVAGHETMGTTVAWALLALARNPAAQATLRASLTSPALDALGGYSNRFPRITMTDVRMYKNGNPPRILVTRVRLG